MNKKELALRLADKLQVSAPQSHRLLNGFLEHLTQAILQKEGAELRGFGTFKVTEHTSQKRNPKTGEQLPPKPRLKVHFKPSKFINKSNSDK